MPEIDTTKFVRLANPSDVQRRSRAERGENAGRDTRENALRESAASPLLNTPEHLNAMREWASNSGGWDDDEVAAFTDNELNALFLQLASIAEVAAELSVEALAGAIRESDLDQNQLGETFGDDGFDYDVYEANVSEGRISGHLYRTYDGRIFYNLES